MYQIKLGKDCVILCSDCGKKPSLQLKIVENSFSLVYRPYILYTNHSGIILGYCEDANDIIIMSFCAEGMYIETFDDFLLGKHCYTIVPKQEPMVNIISRLNCLLKNKYFKSNCVYDLFMNNCHHFSYGAVFNKQYDVRNVISFFSIALFFFIIVFILTKIFRSEK